MGASILAASLGARRAYIFLILAAMLCAARAVPAEPSRTLYNVSTTAELQKALGESAGKGVTINLAPGEYVVQKTLEIRSTHHLNLVGSGWNTSVRKLGNGDAFRLIRCGFCNVRNLMVLGDPAAESGSGIVFKDSSSCTIDFCRIAGFPTSGIRFEGNPKTPMSSNTVSRCHLIGNRGDQLYSLNNNDFFIVGNQFGTHGVFPRTGCVLERSSAGTYSMNYHWGNVNALKMLGSNFNRIENNRFEQSRETGIIIGDPAKQVLSGLNILTGNTIHTNSEAGSGKFPAVEAYDAVDVTFCENQVFSWDNKKVRHKSSLVLGRGCKNWIVKDNIFRHNAEKSVVYQENSGHIIGDNSE